MTSNNFNKILQKNLKPNSLLSKTTTEIVNKCIQKIYKEVPDSFDPKNVKARTENKGPIRTLKSQRKAKQQVNKTTSKTTLLNSYGEQLLKAVMENSMKKKTEKRLTRMKYDINVRNTPNVPKKKPTKSPNYKIYGSRRYGSSASDSAASISRLFQTRRKSRNPQYDRNDIPTYNNSWLRSFNTSQTYYFSGIRSTDAHCLMPPRNQHMIVESRPTLPMIEKPKPIVLSDLFPVDKSLKDLISLRNVDYPKKVEKSGIDPLEGWKHPPPTELFQGRYNRSLKLNNDLNEDHRRQSIANKMKQFKHMRQNELINQLMSSTISIKSSKLSNSISNASKNTSATGDPLRRSVFDRFPKQRFVFPKITKGKLGEKENLDKDDVKMKRDKIPREDKKTSMPGRLSMDTLMPPLVNVTKSSMDTNPLEQSDKILKKSVDRVAKTSEKTIKTTERLLKLADRTVKSATGRLTKTVNEKSYRSKPTTDKSAPKPLILSSGRDSKKVIEKNLTKVVKNVKDCVSPPPTVIKDPTKPAPTATSIITKPPAPLAKKTSTYLACQANTIEVQEPTNSRYSHSLYYKGFQKY